MIIVDFLSDEGVPEIGFGLWCLSFMLLITAILISHYFYNYFVPNGVLVFRHRMFILYLRAFTFDQSEEKVKWAISQFSSNLKIPVLKIADPSKGTEIVVDDNKRKSTFRAFLLPHSNWKKELRFYISRATYIVSVLDITSGVFWEVFENDEFANKFIYVINSKKTLEAILGDSRTKKYANSQIVYCLNELNKRDVLDNTTFCIKDKVCYFSDLSSIFLLIENEHMQDLCYYSFRIPTNICVFSNKADKKHDIYNITTVQRKFLRHDLN